MKYLKTFFLPTISSLNLSPNLFVQNNINLQPKIIAKLNYEWEDTYKSWTNDSSNVYTILKWKNYDVNWGTFTEKYETFRIFGRIGVGIKSEVIKNFELYWEAYFTGGILANFNSSLILSKSYFASATRYTVVNLHIWRDENNIYYQWKAFFKGDAINWIRIELNSVYFY